MNPRKNIDKVKVNHAPLPAKVAQFHFINNIIFRSVPLRIREFSLRTFFYLSGEIPFTISEFFKFSNMGRTFWGAFILTFLLAFVGQVITTSMQGSFNGTDTHKFYFADDWKNIVNYVIVCPMYVGLTSIFC